MMGFRCTGLAALAALLIAGCGSTTKLDEVPVESRDPAPAEGAAAPGAKVGETSGFGRSAQGAVVAVDLEKSAKPAMASAPALANVVYFDYDSFVIKEDYRGLIASYAKLLSANKAKRLLVEGHTDERGGREYNLALGQKRAEAVIKSLTLLGATDSQLEAISYGKERPADAGHDEAALARNRRVELKDR